MQDQPSGDPVRIRPVLDRASAEELLLNNLATIEGIVRHVCRRNRLTDADAEDFAGQVRLRLVEGDYSVLRKFRSRSSLKTYLTAVIQRLFLDHRIREWGKWRPSAEARRRGPVAEQLDRLLTRERLTFDQAVEALRSAGVTKSRDDLYAIAAVLPTRTARRMTTDDELETVSAKGPGPDDALALLERRRTAERARRALSRALDEITPAERLIVRLRFDGGLRIVDIARTLGMEQKPLYRRIESILQDLRRRLDHHGLAAAEVRELLDEPSADVSGVAPLREESGRRPSMEEVESVRGDGRG